MREVITIDGVEYRLRPLTRDAIAAAAAAGQAALLEQQRRAMASPDPRVVQTFVRQAQRFRRAATRFARGDWRSLATIVDAQTLCALAGVEPGDPRHTPALVDAILASKLADSLKGAGTGLVIDQLAGAGRALLGQADDNPYAQYARVIAGIEPNKRAPFLGIPDWIRALPREHVVEEMIRLGAMEIRDGFLKNTFAMGTGGFRDFGAGTPAMLHGREAVVPFGQRESFAMAHSGDLLAELREIRQGLADLPRAMKIAVRDARAFA